MPAEAAGLGSKDATAGTRSPKAEADRDRLGFEALKMPKAKRADVSHRRASGKAGSIHLHFYDQYHPQWTATGAYVAVRPMIVRGTRSPVSE
jgi:hypothetical protein